MFIQSPIPQTEAAILLEAAGLSVKLSENERIVIDLRRLLNDRSGENMVTHLLVVKGGYANFWIKYYELRKVAVMLKLAKPSVIEQN